jgi:succinate dehydrogenase/fumarate reductase flavoprotein subunit
MNPVPIDIDVVVAGSGATGLAAAVTLATGGAKVAVFEKQRALGGTSNFFRGTFAVESEMQRERLIDLTRDQAFRNIMEYSHWKANARLVRTIVDQSAGTIAWLKDQGVTFTGQMTMMPGAPSTYHVVEGTGEAVVKVLVMQAKSKGVQIFPGRRVKALSKENGRISGVVIDDDGQEVNLATRAVIIATGGYANNKEWIKRYTGYDLDLSVFAWGNTGKMGDGIRMAWEAGAAEEGIRPLEMIRVGPVGPEFAMGCTDVEVVAVQPDLWVTIRGERFCDESVAFCDTDSGNVNARLSSDGFTFSLFDDAIIEGLIERGIDRNLGPMFMAGYRPVNVRKEMLAAISGGSKEVFMADSVEALARLIDIEPAALRATVDEYNDHCAMGHDDWFAKDRKFLRPLVGPSYYAVKAHTAFLGTMGGIRINENMEALDKKGAVVPGLYAGGFDAGGMYGDSYPISTSQGLSSAFALNSGRIAGSSALKYLRRA